jgi:hypothetical protein
VSVELREYAPQIVAGDDDLKRAPNSARSRAASELVELPLRLPQCKICGAPIAAKALGRKPKYCEPCRKVKNCDLVRANRKRHTRERESLDRTIALVEATNKLEDAEQRELADVVASYGDAPPPKLVLLRDIRNRHTEIRLINARQGTPIPYVTLKHIAAEMNWLIESRLRALGLTDPVDLALLITPRQVLAALDEWEYIRREQMRGSLITTDTARALIRSDATRRSRGNRLPRGVDEQDEDGMHVVTWSEADYHIHLTKREREATEIEWNVEPTDDADRKLRDYILKWYQCNVLAKRRCTEKESLS